MRSIVQERITATGRALMMTESETPAISDGGELSPELLRRMAATIGIALTPERADALATQAGSHFAILRALDAIADPTAEPATVFRLAAEESGS
jgi:hypothetical protein